MGRMTTFCVPWHGEGIGGEEEDLHLSEAQTTRIQREAYISLPGNTAIQMEEKEFEVSWYLFAGYVVWNVEEDSIELLSKKDKRGWSSNPRTR